MNVRVCACFSHCHIWHLFIFHVAYSITTSNFLPFLPPFFYSSLSKRCLVVILRVRFSMYRNLRNRSTIPALFGQMVKLHPDKPALICEATGEVRTQLQSQRNGPTLKWISNKITSYYCQILLHFHIQFISDLEFQGAAREEPCCGSLGTDTGMDRRRCGSLVHGKPAFNGGSMVGSGYDRRRGCTHQPQPSTTLATALCQCVWCSGNGFRDRDERR